MIQVNMGVAAIASAGVHYVIQKAFIVASILALTAYLFPPQARICDGDTYSYIVVGSGSAGSIIATRLTEDPKVTVLLVEAGGNPPIESDVPGLLPFMKFSRVDWNYTSVRNETLEGLKNERIPLTRGKMLGGSSSMNFMFYVRGSPIDYNNWAKMVNDESWKYDNILEYFKKCENLREQTILESPTGDFHGTEGYVGVTKLQFEESQKYLEAFAEIGHDIVLDVSGINTCGYTQPLVTMADGARQSTARSYLGASKDRPNLYVAKHTMVTEIVFDENKNAIGVIALKQSGEKVMLRALNEVIVSAGAINSPQLLMLSGIGPKKHLEDNGIKVIADLPVGENFQDHLGAFLVYPTDKALPLLLRKPIDPHDYIAPFVLGYVAMNKTQNYPDYQTHVTVIDVELALILCTFYLQIKDEMCEIIYNRSKGKHVMSAVVYPMRPKSRGRILLRSADPLEYPLIYHGVYSDTRDIDDLISYIQDFDRVTESSFFKQHNSRFIVPPQCEGLQRGSREFMECYIRSASITFWHYVGTCPMGSVVDSRLRVYGVSRLRVADASIMPTITSGNTNVPTMMIGEKAADMIKKDNV